MGHQMIQQPNKQWCMFSSITQAIVGYDASEEGLIDYYARKAAEDTRERVRETLDEIKSGKRPYGQFTMTYDEAAQSTRDSGYPWPPPDEPATVPTTQEETP